MQALIDHFNSVFPLQEETMEKLLSLCVVKDYKKKSVLCDFGEVCPGTFFVIDGICRTFVIDSKGKEVNKSLVNTGKLFTSLKSLLFKTPSEYRIETLTDCKLIYLEFESFLYMVENYPDFSHYNFRLTDYLLMQVEDHVTNLLVNNATKKYQELQKRIPDVDTMISQRHIASYIGVTPIQLSRIKKKMLGK